MAAEHESLHVLDGDAERFRDEGAIARRVENSRHADHAIARKSADPVRRLRHGIQGIRDHDQEAIGGILHHLLDGASYDFGVGFQQVVAAHPGLAREAGRHHHEVGVSGVFIIVGAADFEVVAFDRPRLQQVQALALRNAFQDVNQHHVGELLVRQPVRHRRPDVA